MPIETADPAQTPDSSATSPPETGQSETTISPTSPTASVETDVEPPITAPGPASTDAPPAQDGTSGVGDSLFPDLGNPGIDVIHYDLDLTYDPLTTVIEATATLDITATKALSTFTLDQVGLEIASVSIDDVVASFAADDPELWITPVTPFVDGATHTVVVRYSVTANASPSVAGIVAGWFPTDAGSFVLNEPDGARTWFPSNDHPSDKATYRFAITLPDGYSGVANGEFEGSALSTAGGRTWVWNQDEPMTTYVVQVLTGPFTIIESTADSGLALIHAIQTDDVEVMQPFIDVTPEQIDFFDDFFGPYPFDSYGIAMTDGNFGGAMEEQGRSLFSRDDFLDGELGYLQQLLLSHELVHQWFGNAVSPARWQDIWLTESFATYGEWMWLDEVDEIDLAELARTSLDLRQDGAVATGLPGAEQLFGYEVYDGGAVVLHALRLTIGDDVFFDVLARWVGENIDTSRTSEDFIALAEDASGQDLTVFFAEWLYAADLPDQYPG